MTPEETAPAIDAMAAHTPGGYGGVPQSVGKDFASADKAKRLGRALKAKSASLK